MGAAATADSWRGSSALLQAHCCTLPTCVRGYLQRHFTRRATRWRLSIRKQLRVRAGVRACGRASEGGGGGGGGGRAAGHLGVCGHAGDAGGGGVVGGAGHPQHQHPVVVLAARRHRRARGPPAWQRLPRDVLHAHQRLSEDDLPVQRHLRPAAPCHRSPPGDDKNISASRSWQLMTAGQLGAALCERLPPGDGKNLAGGGR